MKIRFSALVIIIGALFVGCSGSKFANIADLESTLDPKKKPIQENYPNDEAVIVSKTQDVSVSLTSDYDLYTYETYHVVMKLFRNIEDYATVKINVYNGEDITEISARTIKPDGTVIELKETDFYKTTGGDGGSTFYTDTKSIKFTFPGIEKNCYIEYRYKKYESFPFYNDSWNIQTYIPVIKNTFKLTAPQILIAPKSAGGADWSWRYKVYNMPNLGGPKYEEPVNASGGTKDQMVTYTWTVNDIPAFVPDRLMTAHDTYLAYIKFAPSDWKSWNDISSWYYKTFFYPQFKVTDDVKLKANSIIQKGDSEEKQIADLFRYVQKLRYISIALGDGGLRPHFPSEVLKNAYGDCKDKSMLLISMLQSLNISAKPVLVLTLDDGRIDPNFPNWNFNHMIVKAQTASGKVFWMDPTVEFAKPNDLTWAVEGINVLVINSDGTSTIEKTPSSTSNDNIVNIDSRIEMGTDDSLNFNIKLTYRGEDNVSMRSRFKDMSSGDIRSFCKSLLADDFVNAQVKKYTISSVDSLTDQFTIDFSFSTSNALQRQGDLYFLNTDPFLLMSNLQWLSKDNRQYPVEFAQPYSITKKFTIILPDKKYKVRNLPNDLNLENKFLSYKKAFRKNTDNSIEATEKYEVKTQYIPEREYKTIKKFYEEVKAKISEKVIYTN